MNPLTLIGMSSENKKNLVPPKSKFYKIQWASIGVNFHLQKSLEVFDTNSADKIQSQNYKGGKSALPNAY